MAIKVQKHSNIYCKACDELIFTATILRHETNGAPVEQTIYPEYCPICGAKLIPFKGFVNERMYTG